MKAKIDNIVRMNNPVGFLIRCCIACCYKVSMEYAVLRGKVVKVPPYARPLINAMATMDDWEKGKVVHLLIRIRNGDKKVDRYFEMLEKGHISRRQFLEAM